jgi:hypothetical protein
MGSPFEQNSGPLSTQTVCGRNVPRTVRDFKRRSDEIHASRTQKSGHFLLKRGSTVGEGLIKVACLRAACPGRLENPVNDQSKRAYLRSMVQKDTLNVEVDQNVAYRRKTLSHAK